MGVTARAGMHVARMAQLLWGEKQLIWAVSILILGILGLKDFKPSILCYQVQFVSITTGFIFYNSVSRLCTDLKFCSIISLLMQNLHPKYKIYANRNESWHKNYLVFLHFFIIIEKYKGEGKRKRENENLSKKKFMVALFPRWWMVHDGETRHLHMF